jgi:hypothetical protein
MATTPGKEFVSATIIATTMAVNSPNPIPLGINSDKGPVKINAVIEMA